MGKLPSTLLRRPSLAGCLPSSTSPNLSHTAAPLPSQCTSGATRRLPQQGQVRHATFVPRSRRPYQFTQLVQLSDGSTFTVRTTSPLALYKSAKDSRNHILWNPTEKSLRNVEVDEAGKLAAFRERYGTAWDLGGPSSASASGGAVKPEEAATTTTAAAAPKDGKKAATAAAPAEKKEGGEEEVDKKKKKKNAVEAKEATKTAEAQAPVETAAPAEDPFASLVDLISAYATEDKSIKGGLSAKDQAKKDKTSKKK